MMLAYYESIRQISHRMLTAARRSDWDEVARAEAEVGSLAARLNEFGDPRRHLAGDGHTRRFEILRHVLADDAEIRDLADPELRLIEAERGIGPGARTGPPRRR